MLSEFGAVEPVMFAYVYRFSFPGNMRVCGHWAGDWCSPCIGTGFDTLTFFFSRVRTPCGHGAQVIVEGREEQSDGGEKNKDNQNNPKPNKPQPTGRVSTIM